MSIDIVQHVSGSNNAAAATAVANVSAIRESSALAIICGIDSSAATVVSITDNGGTANTYEIIKGCTVVTPGMLQGFIVRVCKVGATTITVTFTDSTAIWKGIWVFELQGVNALDTFAVADNQTTSATPSGASLTPIADHTFLMSCIFCNGSITSNPNAGNEFTYGGDIDATSGDRASLSLVTLSKSAHTPQWALGSSQPFCSITFSMFKTPNVAGPQKSSMYKKRPSGILVPVTAGGIN